MLKQEAGLLAAATIRHGDNAAGACSGSHPIVAGGYAWRIIRSAVEIVTEKHPRLIGKCGLAEKNGS